VFGAILGFVIGRGTVSPQLAGSVHAPLPSGSPATPTPALVDERQLQALRGIVASDPRNAKAAIELGNMLYDAGRYREAIPVYQQAFALQPANVEVSTDLGTALWYSADAPTRRSRSIQVARDQPHARPHVVQHRIVTLTEARRRGCPPPGGGCSRPTPTILTGRRSRN
jgi:hypothetical protein